MSLKGSKIVVVGGSSGIGLGVAQAAIDRGAAVVLVGAHRTSCATQARRWAPLRT
jgi:NAD(P)-dependent dehydrogenase (short-subunit alcohol dehydrogenase family)